jgi:hypothetical protein
MRAEKRQGILYVTLTYLEGSRPSRIYRTKHGFEVKVYVDRVGT